MKDRKPTVLVLLAVSSLYVTGASISGSLPQMAEVFSNIPHAELLVKLTLTLPALFIALISPAAGSISDRFGRKKILIISLVTYGIGGFSGFLLKDLRLILAGRALLGLSLGTLFTTASALIGDNFSGEQRKKVISMQGASVSLGGLIYVGGSGFLAEIGWKVPFITYLVSFLILPAALRILKEPEHCRDEIKTAETGKRQTPAGTIVFINISVFISMVFFLMIHTQLPFILRESGKNSSSLMGVLLILLNVVGFFTAASYPRIRQRLSYIRVYALFFLSMGIGFALIGIGPGSLSLIAGILFCGIGAGIVVPNTSLWLQEITAPESRGRIMGIMTAATFLGQFLSPMIIQPVLDLLTGDRLFSLTGVFMMILGLLYFGPGRASRRASVPGSRAEQV